MYQEKTRGVLYQIALSYEEASRYSYASISCGPVEEFRLPDSQVTYDLSQILPLLSDPNIAESNYSYISSLQARLLLHPHLQMQARRMEWQPLEKHDHQAYRVQLERITKRIAYQMLNQSSILSFLNPRMPIKWGLTFAYAQNDLSFSPPDLAKQFTAALKAGNLDTIHKIFAKHPKFKVTEITMRINPFYGTPVKGVPIFELFASSQFKVEDVIDCVGPGWIDLVVRHNKDRELIWIFPKIPKEYHVELLMAIGPEYCAKGEYPSLLRCHLAPERRQWFQDFIANNTKVLGCMVSR